MTQSSRLAMLRRPSRRFPTFPSHLFLVGMGLFLVGMGASALGSDAFVGRPTPASRETTMAIRRGPDGKALRETARGAVRRISPTDRLPELDMQPVVGRPTNSAARRPTGSAAPRPQKSPAFESLELIDPSASATVRKARMGEPTLAEPIAADDIAADDASDAIATGAIMIESDRAEAVAYDDETSHEDEYDAEAVQYREPAVVDGLGDAIADGMSPTQQQAFDGIGTMSQACSSWSNWVVGSGEYLLLRPSFSNATALYRNTLTGGTASALVAENYAIGYSSGLRVFAGWRISPDRLVRFSYLTVDGGDTVLGQASGNWAGGDGTAYVGPYNTDALVSGDSIRAEVNTRLQLYDLEMAGRLDTWFNDDEEPLWEAAGGVGLRFADVGVSSEVTNIRTECDDCSAFVTTDRTFRGVGPRLAYQLRRLIGSRLSLFAAGAGALLIGDYRNVDTRLTASTTVPASESQQVGGPLLVPNVDLSLGASWQIASGTSFSAGWMLMYFGQLGYSELIDTSATTPGSIATSVPLTTSSLAYDGVFFRLTHNF